MMKMQFTILIFTLLISNSILCQRLDQSPHSETRLWCPEDIENFYDELVANRTREKEPNNPSEADENRLYRRDGWEYRGDPNSMRNTAYHILRSWPEAQEGVRDVMKYSSFIGNMAINGYDLLVAVWRRIVHERDIMRGELWAVTDKPTHNLVHSRYNQKWGSEPINAPPRDIGYSIDNLPEECDCQWYLAIKYESDDIQFKAALIKSGSIFEIWDSDNTKVKAYLAGNEGKLLAPYPTNILFLIRVGDSRIKFSDFIILSKKRGKFFEINPRPYTGRNGSKPHLQFDIEYPLWDEKNHKWLSAEAILSSSPSNLWERINSNFPKESEGLNSGKIFRSWAGDYKPEDQMK